MTKTEFKQILEDNRVVVVECGAEWCGPCRTMEPIMHELAVEFDGKAKILQLDVEEEEELIAEFRIRNVPTILYFKDGELKDKMVGAHAKANVADKINSYID